MKVETSAETVMVIDSSTDSNGEKMETDRSSVVGSESSEIPCLGVIANSNVMETSPVYMQTSSVVVAKPFVASDFVAYLHLLAQSLPSILECCTSTDRSQVEQAVEEIRRRVVPDLVVQREQELQNMAAVTYHSLSKLMTMSGSSPGYSVREVPWSAQAVKFFTVCSLSRWFMVLELVIRWSVCQSVFKRSLREMFVEVTSESVCKSVLINVSIS